MSVFMRAVTLPQASAGVDVQVARRLAPAALEDAFAGVGLGRLGVLLKGVRQRDRFQPRAERMVDLVRKAISNSCNVHMLMTTAFV